MYMALIALLGAASTWVVLRKNPAFSARYVLRFFVVLTAMVGAFVLAMLATIKYTERLPQSLQLGAIFGVVGLGTLAMIAAAIQASLPEGAPLPASAKRLNVFRKRTYVWARRLGWALLAFALLMLLLRGTAQAVVGTLGGLFGFLGIVLVFGLWLTARRTDRWLSAVEANPWVHWIYTPEQWRQWTEVAVQREAPAKASLVLRRKLNAADLEVYFGQDGLFASGEFTPWLSAGVYLQAAFLDEREPRSVALLFRKVVSGYGSTYLVPKTLRLPVPECKGVDNDLARLQQELSNRCQKAAITLA